MADLQRFWVNLRRAQPRVVKQMARALRAVATPWSPSPAIPQETLEHCHVLADRTILAQRLPKGGVIAEIGVEHGYYSQEILDISRPSELHLFDLDFGTTAQHVLSDPAVRLHKGPSAETLALMPDASFDWIYVDGDHSAAGVQADASVAMTKVKPGGFIVFSDYGIIDPYLGRYGVHEVVSAFIARERWPVRYLALNTMALHDIAVQRPL
jgi:hypothetical protein